MNKQTKSYVIVSKYHRIHTHTHAQCLLNDVRRGRCLLNEKIEKLKIKELTPSNVIAKQLL